MGARIAEMDVSSSHSYAPIGSNTIVWAIPKYWAALDICFELLNDGKEGTSFVFQEEQSCKESHFAPLLPTPFADGQ